MDRVPFGRYSQELREEAVKMVVKEGLSAGKAAKHLSLPKSTVENLVRAFRAGKIGPTRKGKGTKWMVAPDGKGIPVALHLESASRAEIKLLETTLEKVKVP